MRAGGWAECTIVFGNVLWSVYLVGVMIGYAYR